MNAGDPNLPPTVRQALEASAAGDADGALRLLRLAASEDPSAAVPQFLLGAELAQLGDMREAESAFANAVLLAPGFHIARFQLGLVQFTSGQAALALVTWSPLLALGDQSALCHFVRGFAALAQDRFDEALTHLQGGIDINAENAPLNDDMRKLMARIRQVQADSQDTASTEATSESAAGHVLLANYQSRGRLN